MTILQAIIKVLEKEDCGLPCKAITDKIIGDNLYSFNTPDPNAVVRYCLRKHCQGLEFASAHPQKYFFIISGKRETTVYCLLSKKKTSSALPEETKTSPKESDMLPEEKMQKYYEIHTASIKHQLLDCILNNDPSFFEHLVVKLLLALGYGYGSEAGQVVGKSHDGGIDGIINEDKLGLDKIYIQAKRYSTAHNVSSKEVQAFAGAMKKATKGVFITTSSFTKEARREAIEQFGKQIVLIDGAMLTDLMLRCGIGIRSVETYCAYEVDSEFFNNT